MADTRFLIRYTAQSFYLQRGRFLSHDLASSHYQFFFCQQWVPQFSIKFQYYRRRHPIVEAISSTQERSFIATRSSIRWTRSFPSDIGPNIWEENDSSQKQNALILVLAHSGLSVSAASATIPPVDAILPVVGTGDILQTASTFYD